MDLNSNKEMINCPCCSEEKKTVWAEENGYIAVKCVGCGLVYVNPRPRSSLINDAVKTGVHSDVEHGRTAVVRRVEVKIFYYKNIIKKMFCDVLRKGEKISWLDVGAGYGEFVEALSLLAPHGSNIEGLEPMKPKADNARARGLNIKEMYLNEINERYNFVSLINVFSHIPDFKIFLEDIKNVLVENGELLIETGNAGDLRSVSEVPGELDLPDHLVFAGEKNMVHFLNDAGFTVVCIKKIRTDGIINFLKNCLKKIVGRNVNLGIPYTSKYRSLFLRAKLIE